MRFLFFNSIQCEINEYGRESVHNRKWACRQNRERLTTAANFPGQMNKFAIKKWIESRVLACRISGRLQSHTFIYTRCMVIIAIHLKSFRLMPMLLLFLSLSLIFYEKYDSNIHQANRIFILWANCVGATDRSLNHVQSSCFSSLWLYSAIVWYSPFSADAFEAGIWFLMLLVHNQSDESLIHTTGHRATMYSTQGNETSRRIE